MKRLWLGLALLGLAGGCGSSTAQCDEEPGVCSGATGVCNQQTGECVACTNFSHCGADEECNLETNTCEPFVCTPDEDGHVECESRDVRLSFCGEGGSCVECLEHVHCTTAAAPACDLDSNECRPCKANNECSSGWCDEELGRCGDESEIIYVAPVGGSAATDCGSRDAPCDSVASGFRIVDPGRRTFVLLAGDHDEKVELKNRGAVRIVGAPGARLSPSLQGADAVVNVVGLTFLEMEDVALTPAKGGLSDSVGLRCQPENQSFPTVKFIDGLIVGANGAGIEVQQCALTLERSLVRDNSGGGISISESDYSVVNNVVVDNISTSSVGGIRVVDTAGLQERIEHNTFAQNERSQPDRFELSCENSDLHAVGNIFMFRDGFDGQGGTLVGGDCSFGFSLFDEDDTTAPNLGNGNIPGSASFVDSLDGDFHLAPGSPCIDAADPTSTLDVDFDGDPRPQGDAPDMGADEAG